MQANLYWDISEMVAEVEMFHPTIQTASTHFREIAADMVALSLRDMNTGTHNYLDDFIDQNLGSEFQGLGLFFRSYTVRWLQEIVVFADMTTRDFDWFEIDDITQTSPTLLLVKLNVGYYS